MKTSKLCLPLLALFGLALAPACSSLGGKTASDEQLSSQGPTILNARVSPSPIELNTQLQPTQQVEILADVKDFNANINDVRLRFVNVPLEVPMKNVGGTTWRATLSPKQLQMLAVSGKTMEYQANVIAKNEAGEVAVGSDPLMVAVNTPDLAKDTG
ncbi:MAG TPA: hypothetical protein VM598_11780 [Bdellovibrionota bacterium]|jgi:hypothetical protein|nr:hypothetical protein [Bdellovibrionota bacterium]